MPSATGVQGMAPWDIVDLAISAAPSNQKTLSTAGRIRGGRGHRLAVGSDHFDARAAHGIAAADGLHEDVAGRLHHRLECRKATRD